MNYITFNAALAAFLRETGLTPTAVARLAGLSHSTVARYVSNERDASTENMAAICYALDIEARYKPGRGWVLIEK